MPSSWPMVITPVPPMPVTRTPKGASSAGQLRLGQVGNRPRRDARGATSPFFSCPPSTVTKLGQKPLTQE